MCYNFLPRRGGMLSRRKPQLNIKKSEFNSGFLVPPCTITSCLHHRATITWRKRYYFSIGDAVHNVLSVSCISPTCAILEGVYGLSKLLSSFMTVFNRHCRVLL